MNIITILKTIRNKFRRKPKFKYVEGVDFTLMPDMEAIKANDPNPWNIWFRGRLFKVLLLKIPKELAEDGHLHIDIKLKLLHGKDFEQSDSDMLGGFLMELVQRNMLARE